MRRILATAGTLLLVGLLLTWPATGSDGGDYKVRAVFDNGGFIVNGEEVRIAGASVGTVESVDVSTDDEIVSLEGGEHAIPGKAVVVLNIQDGAFKDFRQDATCIIRPQSLIGEKYVDCTPTQPRAPGSEPPPELEPIPNGQPGAGQRLLPVENNGKSVDLDLINNIQRASYRDRFRLILNDLGAGLAARGEDLGEVIDRANPALRQTNRVLNILALQNRQLASLASNGDAVLEPLARNRTSITGFFRNAAIAGEATAERSADLELGLQRFPATLRQLRLTMAKLKQFTDQGTPLFTDLNIAAPGLSKATQKLAPFATAAIPAFDTLGDASQSSGPKLAAANGLLTDTANAAVSSVPVGENFGPLLDTFEETQGFKYLMDFIFNTVGSVNGFDAFGHFLRSNVQISNCVSVTSFVIEGCEAFFRQTQVVCKTKKKKKKKKGKKAVAVESTTGGAAEPSTAIAVESAKKKKKKKQNPDCPKKKKKKKKGKKSARTAPSSELPIPPVEIPPIEDLVPPASKPATPGEAVPPTGTTPAPSDPKQAEPNAVSMRRAKLFLRYLLGST